MIERMQALATVGRLDGILHEIIQTRHELSKTIIVPSHPLLEEGKGLIVNMVV